VKKRQASTAPDIDDIACALYALVPSSFTAARNTRAKEATAAGDPELASAIRELPKPTAAAWLANTLARQQRAAIEDLIALGPQLRDAQSQRRRDDMREISDRRRLVIRDLVAAARAVAVEAGEPFSAAVARQLEETLEAAVADEATAERLAHGQVHEAVRFVGFGGSSLSTTGRRPPPPTSDRGRRASGPAPDEEGAASARRQAEAARQAALQVLDQANEKVEAARQRRDESAERVRAATRDLRGAERASKEATEALVSAREELAGARRALKEAGT
jgi:hypothetical protein